MGTHPIFESDFDCLTEMASGDGSSYDHLFKLLVIGDAGVGKSAILVRFSDNIFTDSYINTIGVDFKIRTVEVNGEKVKLQIWDTAGQERFRTITSTYYRGTNGIIVVFDVTNNTTFDNVRKWLLEINDNDCNQVPKVLVGNKIDCPTRCVDREAAEKFAKSKKLKYFESSAKQNQGIYEIFHCLTELGLQKKMPNKAQNDTIVPQNKQQAKKKKKKSFCSI